MIYSIGAYLRQLREDKGMLLSEASEASGIELSIISKIETGKRLPTNDQLQTFARLYDSDYHQLLVLKESDKIISSSESTDVTIEALKVAMAKLSHEKTDSQTNLLEKPIALESRRYIGSKSKLTDWIFDIIDQNTQNVHSFCDIFYNIHVIFKKSIFYCD